MTAVIFLVKISIYLVLFMAVAFFAGSETAITSLDRRSIEKLGNDRFRRWLEYPESILSTLLIGTNVAMVGLGVVAVSIAADMSQVAGRFSRFSWVFPVITPFLVLIFGEILSKTYSRYHAQKIGGASIGILTKLSEAMDFANRWLIGISETIIGKKRTGEFSKKSSGYGGVFATAEPSFKSRPEIKRFLDSSELPFTRDTRTFLKNIVDFRLKKIKDVMIPRRDITAVDITRPREEVFEKIIKSGYSRVPAYRDGNLDNIAGIIYAKDIAYSYRNKDLIVIDDLLRPAYFFPENIPVDKLLARFREGRFHMALIVDEHGLLTGLVTIEDIVEEIVGEVWDEHDMVETTVERFPDGSVVYKGDVPVRTLLADFKELNIHPEDYSTVGGWVAVLFGEIPVTGARIMDYDGKVDIEVIDADSRRIKKVRIKKSGKIN